MNYSITNINLIDEVNRVLASLMTTSEVASAAYDTAWLLRLSNKFPRYSFDSGIDWLRRHQHEDGSWGSDVYFYHDRLICTLVATLALLEVGDPQDRFAIQKAKIFLNQPASLEQDLMDTIAYPHIVAALADEIALYGIYIGRHLIPRQKIKKKNATFNISDASSSSLYYSYEVLVDRVLPIYSDSGSVAASPAATCAGLMRKKSEKAIDYLYGLLSHQGDGGLPVVDYIDTFEIVWCLNNLKYAGLIEAHDSWVQVVVERLWEIWQMDKPGVAFSSQFTAYDLDDTAIAYSLLRWAGYEPNPIVFEQFEGDDYFHCFPNETDPSLSANIRMLIALQDIDHPQKEIWEAKVTHAIRDWTECKFWYDKWHISPYYLTAGAIWMLDGILDDLLPEKMKWIVGTQRANGGWGFYDQSTIEETAYCVQALAHWYLKYGQYRHELERGLHYLNTAPEDYPAMWISKCLYTPHKVIRSSVIAARYMGMLAV